MKSGGRQEGHCTTTTFGNRVAPAVITKSIDAFKPKVSTLCPEEVASR